MNYVRPQEHGNHTQVRMLRIGDMEFASADGMDCAVSEYSTEALCAAEHTDELVRDGKIHLRVDYKMPGLGSGSCGPELMEKYRLSEKKIHFSFSMKPAAATA